MTDEPPEDLSKQDLWNRLRRLEQEVFPDRREILRKGAAAASLGAAGMIGRASAAPGDDGETTWGSANNRDSWYADEIDANSVSTAQQLVSIHMSSNQSVRNGASETVQFDTVISDELSNNWDTANYSLDVATSGKYILTGVAHWNPDSGWSTGDRCEIRPTVNGTRVNDGFSRKVSTESQQVERSVIRSLSVGDTVSFSVFQDSGASKPLNGGDIKKTSAYIARLG